GDACAGGRCTGAARDCSAGDGPCMRGVCDEAADACAPQPREDGTPCDDALLCTTGDACAAGMCTGQPLDCTALDGSCVVGACDEGAGGCVASPRADGSVCEDGAYCTAGDVCRDGACAPGGLRDCSGVAGPGEVGVCDEANDACIARPASGPCD